MVWRDCDCGRATNAMTQREKLKCVDWDIAAALQLWEIGIALRSDR